MTELLTVPDWTEIIAADCYILHDKTQAGKFKKSRHQILLFRSCDGILATWTNHAYSRVALYHGPFIYPAFEICSQSNSVYGFGLMANENLE